MIIDQVRSGTSCSGSEIRQAWLQLSAPTSYPLSAGQSQAGRVLLPSLFNLPHTDLRGYRVAHNGIRFSQLCVSFS